MAANDRFQQESGDPGTTIAIDDIGIVYWVFQGELTDKVDPTWFLTTSGEQATGAAFTDPNNMPYVEVWVSEVGDDRAFSQITNAGHVYRDVNSFLGPPSGYVFSIFYYAPDTVWAVRVMHGGMDDDNSALPDLLMDPEAKRLVWIHVIGASP